MAPSPQTRDAGVRRVTRLTSWAMAGAVALSAAVTFVVAKAQTGARRTARTPPPPPTPPRRSSSGPAPAPMAAACNPRSRCPSRAAPVAAAAASRTRAGPDGRVGRIRFPALGTTAVVVTADADRVVAAALEVRREVDAIDLACSRFRDDSDLARVNAAPAAGSRSAAPARGRRGRAARRPPHRRRCRPHSSRRSVIANGYDRDFADIAPGRSRGSAARGARLARRRGRPASVPDPRARGSPSWTSERPRRRSPPTGRRARAAPAPGPACSSASAATSRSRASRRRADGRSGPDDHARGRDAGADRALAGGGLATSSTTVRAVAARRRRRPSHRRPAHRRASADASGGP